MSKIQWTEKTWNPVAGCSLVSPGCQRCYAMKMAGRLEAMGQAKYAGLTHKVNGHRVWTGKINLDETALTIPLRTKRPTTWFVNSMSDLFHDDVPIHYIQNVFRVMEQTPHHTYQILTKRAPRMAEEVNRWVHGCGHGVIKNGWFGVSVEDQKRADERIPNLLRCPAAVRFLSVEPLLEAVDLGNWLSAWWTCINAPVNGEGRRPDWVIVGGESGHGARPCNVEWIRSIVRQCKAAGVACFVKQLGANVVDQCEDCTPEYTGWPASDGPMNWETGGVMLKDPKGGTPEEWPEDLRIRQMPEVAR